MSVLLIRHGKTKGNLERRYIGCSTDEPLSEEGRRELSLLRIPPVKTVYTSPMKRCLMTAALLCPEKTPVIIEDFRECDFGAFENRNYEELKDEPAYQRWLASGGTLPFPGGESREQFCSRSVSAFEKLMPAVYDGGALFVHGGTVMAIMEAFARPHGDYYDFQTGNGHGFLLEEDGRFMPI